MNYLKVIFRNLIKNRFYTFLNFLGLSIGFSAFLYMTIYVHFETHFEDFHSNADRIYRLTHQFTSGDNYSVHWARTPFDFINELPNDFPAVKAHIRFQNHERKYIRIGNEKFRPEHAYVTDANVFDVFDFKLLSGNPATALAQPYSVVISESLARQYFGNGDPINQEIFVVGDWDDKETRHLVTGVMKDLPPNTHMPVNVLISFKDKASRTGWAYSYILLEPGASISQVEAGMNDFIKKYNSEEDAKGVTLIFQPLSDIHLQSNLAREIVPNGNAFYVKVVALAGIFILLIAVINFMNLNGAMALGRAKEVGVRTILGATPLHLKFYLLSESVVYHLIALLFGAAITYLTFPFFQGMINIGFLLNLWTFAATMLFVATACGLLAGLYPLFLLTSLKPVHAIKSGKALSLAGANSAFSFKRVMVTLQFTISIILLAGGLVAWSQFRFLQEKNLGINYQQTIAIPGVPDKIKSEFFMFKNQVKTIPGISGVTSCMEVPSREIRDAGPVLVEGENDDPSKAPVMDIQIMDRDFIDVMGIEFLKGENIPASLATDRVPTLSEDYTIDKYLLEQRRSYVINETAMRRIGWQSPEEAIGQNISWSISGLKLAPGPITGVVKDFHQETLKNKVDPVIMVYEPIWLRTFLIKVETKNIQTTVNQIKSVWDKMFPLYPMEYYFLDDLYENLYKGERVQLQLLYISSGLAVLIAFIGLVGLIAYSLTTRVKEIAIRQVLGATFRDLISLFSREYFWVLLIAGLCAVPVSYYGANEWLSNFAYHVGISPAIYLLTLTFIAVMLLLTIGLQILRSSLENPGSTLRDE